MNALLNGKPSSNRFQMVKILAIPVLGFILYSQITGPLDALKDAPPMPTPTTVRAATAGSNAPARDAVPILSTVRPVEHIAETDPFALPESLLPPPVEVPTTVGEFLEAATSTGDEPAEPELDGWDGTKQRWEAERVSIVLSTPTGLVAVVGDRMLRVGDELEDGCRVVEIRSDGIVAERVPATETE